MANDAPRGIGQMAFTGLLLIVLGAGFQAACLPTVEVSCPARSAAAPDCELRWLVGFDTVPVRRTALPGLQPVGEIESTAPSRQGGATTLYLDTAAGRVRTIMWGDHLSLQRDLQEPLRAYLADPAAPATTAVMPPSLWTDPGGDAPDRLVRQRHPGWYTANGLVAAGLLFWLGLPAQWLRGRR